MATCKSCLATRPLLYTDSIKGQQVCRDDMWAVTTEELNKLHEELEALKASQGEPVAWMGYSPRDGRVEFSIDKPAPSVMRDFNMRPLYTSVPTIPEGYLLAEKACREFIRKVENGEARSTRSYAAMKMAIDLIDTIGWSTKKKWGE